MIGMSVLEGAAATRSFVGEQCVRSAVFGRTWVRSLAVPQSATLCLPLSQGHDGDLNLCLVSEGRVTLGSSPDQQDELVPGDAVVALDTRSLRADVCAGTCIVQISIPQLALESPVPVETGTVIRSERVQMTWPVLTFTENTFRMGVEETSSLSIYYVERLLQEMTIGVLVDNARSRVMPQSPNTFTVALSVIASQCSDAALRPSRIAEQVGLSLRQLQRVFSGHDTTVEQEIRRERVEQAVAMLRSPAYDALTVDQIARYVGFSNGSGLARAMTALGHPSPRQLRRLAIHTQRA